VAGVTLVGLGGAGKTALALGGARWLALTHAPQMAGGIFFFAFADRDADGQTFHPDLSALLRIVGRHRHGDRFLRKRAEEQQELVAGFLQETPCLLVLDNLEAVCGLGEQPALLNETEREEFRRFLRTVCPPGGATRLLLTSRREEPWLGLNTEALEVGGLGAEAAGELALAVLRHRIGPAGVEERLTDAAWQKDYDALLTELGGHPLALQIILPHLQSRPPAEVRRSLSAGARWLDGRLPDGGSDRERTLAGCINYSFAALPEATRALLPVVAYFREWADAEQLAHLSAEEGVPAPARGVTAARWTAILVQAQATGLVKRGGTSLFKLHPLLPWFLHSVLREDEATALQTAARRHFARLASALSAALEGEEGAGAVRLFDVSRASLFNALTLARQGRAGGEVASLYGCLSAFLDLASQHGQLEALRDALIAEWRPATALDPRSDQGRFWLTLQLHRANAHLRWRKGSRAEGDKSRATPKPGLRCVAMRVLADTAVDQTNGTSLGRNLRLHNKFRTTGDFGPLPASGAVAAEGAEKCQALVPPGEKARLLLIASILPTMAYAKASASRDSLEGHVRQRETRLPEHEAAEEGQVDAARHLQQRVEVGDRREAAQPPGQARAAAPAQHGEGIEDSAVADQVEHGVDLPGLGDPFGKVRPLDLRPDGAERLQHREPVTAAGGGDDLRPGVDRHVEGRLAEGRGSPRMTSVWPRATSRLRNRHVQAVA
jgi:hypothetical protein